jgi:hypothetical protein
MTALRWVGIQVLVQISTLLFCSFLNGQQLPGQPSGEASVPRLVRFSGKALDEQVKPEKEQGLYLHPELFDATEEKSIIAARHPGLTKMMKERKTHQTNSTGQ